jgi:hypothetical protein
MVTQNDIEILLQPTKTIYCKLEVLDTDFRKLDSIEGNLISDNLSIQSDSNMRRTYNCELLVTNKKFLIGKNNYIWFTRFVKPYVGVKSQRTQAITWYCLGTFLFNDESYQYNATTNQLSLSCVDMMALLDDTRKGQLDQYNRKIKRGSDVRSVIISLLNEIGISKYYIEFNKNNQTVYTFEMPYDKTFPTGTTAFEMIKELVDLYAGTQMYFDIDGMFCIKRIPTGENETIVLDDSIMQRILIDEQTSTSFSSVYNHIIIWGKVNEPDYYSEIVSMNGNTYNASIIEVGMDEEAQEKEEIEYTEYGNFDEFSIRIPSTNIENQLLSINSLPAYPIVYDVAGYFEPLPKGYLDANTDCVFRYRKDTNDFLFLGQYQCYGEAYLTNNLNDTNKYAVTNDKSDFSLEVIGKRLKTLNGGDYDNIYTDSLACQRARYELYNATHKQESMNFNIVAVPWLDVNHIIRFTSNTNHETNEWIINSISCDYSTFTMSVTASRYYPTYI